MLYYLLYENKLNNLNESSSLHSGLQLTALRQVSPVFLWQISLMAVGYRGTQVAMGERVNIDSHCFQQILLKIRVNIQQVKRQIIPF
jgi:hypothetical protein